MTTPPPDPRWSRRQIPPSPLGSTMRASWATGLRRTSQAARRAELPPLLAKESIRLRPRGDGNFELPDFAGIIIRRNFWCWIDTDKGGNAIDFFTVVLGRTFHQAMTVIMEQIERDSR